MGNSRGSSRNTNIAPPLVGSRFTRSHSGAGVPRKPTCRNNKSQEFGGDGCRSPLASGGSTAARTQGGVLLRTKVRPTNGRPHSLVRRLAQDRTDKKGDYIRERVSRERGEISQTSRKTNAAMMSGLLPADKFAGEKYSRPLTRKEEGKSKFRTLIERQFEQRDRRI